MSNNVLTILNENGTTEKIKLPMFSLKAVRVNANLSQTKLSELLVVDRQTIINWEKGHTQPATPWVKEFARVCDDFPIDFIDLPFNSTKCR